MIERALSRVAFSPEWGRQMRFIMGARQAGKTTLARNKLRQERSEGLYYLWDLRRVRERYKQNQLFFTEDRPPERHKQWVCFDELHKMPKWKNILKTIFDSSQDHYCFIVTGSAKFDLRRRAGDSLSGRFFSFQLFPLMLSELTGSGAHVPDQALDFIQQRLDASTPSKDYLSTLLEFGGFPEPFIRQSKAFHARWARDYTDTVIKEDVRALTRIIDQEHLYDLYRLLPEMVGSPLSESSLAAHLEISGPTVKNYLRRLGDFYLAFKLSPYSRNIKRALLKAPKGYLYDWSQVSNPSKRFENFVAVQLLAKLSLWNEQSGQSFRLFYVRTKDKQETDFLILRDEMPWLLLEAKLSDGPMDSHHVVVQESLKGIPWIQVCRQEGVAKMTGKNRFHVSASRLLG